MPKKLTSCVLKVKKKYSNGKYNPWAVCIASTGLKPHKITLRRMKGGKK